MIRIEKQKDALGCIFCFLIRGHERGEVITIQPNFITSNSKETLELVRDLLGSRRQIIDKWNVDLDERRTSLTGTETPTLIRGRYYFSTEEYPDTQEMRMIGMRGIYMSKYVGGPGPEFSIRKVVKKW